jgi:hypothetical protein
MKRRSIDFPAEDRHLESVVRLGFVIAMLSGLVTSPLAGPLALTAGAGGSLGA